MSDQNSENVPQRAEEIIQRIEEFSQTMEQTPENMVSVGLAYWRASEAGGLERARIWLEKAANLGDLEATDLLGSYTRDVLLDLDTAAQLWEKAARLGNASAANSLIYSFLIPNKEWDKVDEFVEMAVLANQEDQSTNAISNGAIAKYLQGDTEEAKKQFQRALERDDHYSEAEASWWLAMIYNQEHDVDNEAIYASRCFSAGGFNQPEIAPRYKDIVNIDLEYPINVSLQIEGNKLKHFAKYIEDCTEVVTPRFNGVFDVDSGMFGIAGAQLPPCPECSGICDSSIQYSCETCGRSPENYMFLRSGVGDGIYANFNLYWDSACAGSITVFDQGNSFALKLNESFQGMREGTVQDNQATLDFWDLLKGTDSELDLHFCGDISTEYDPRWSPSTSPYGSLYFADAGEGLNSLSSVIYNKNFPQGRHRVYLYGYRDSSNGDVLVPVLVLTLRADLADKLALPNESSPTTDWTAEVVKWNNSLVSSSLGGGELNSFAAQINTRALLGLGNNPDLDELTKKDFEVLTYSWLLLQKYQGSLPDEVNEVLNQLSLRSVQISLRMRGLNEIADGLESWPSET